MNWTLRAAALAACLTLALACKGPTTSAPASLGGAKPPKANPVVVVLNVDKIMKDSNLSKGIQNELRTWMEGKQADLKARAEAIQRQESAKTKPPAELEGMKREFFQTQEMAKEELSQRQAAAAGKMKESFEPLVKQLAKEQGWDIVLNSNEQITIFSNDALDQTDFVISKLNAPAAPSAGATPPQPKP